MGRYTRIISATFGQTALPLPVSIRLSRHAGALATGADSDSFATSIQLDRPILTAEVRIRDIAAAEALTLGDIATLSFTIASAEGQQARIVSLVGSVLTDVRLSYEQSGMATAELKFAAEAQSGAIDPFAAEVQE